MKKSSFFLAVLLLLCSLSACGRADEIFTVPTAGAAGGYHIAANGIEITVYATGSSKFVELITADGRQLQACYSPSEVLLVDVTAGQTSYTRQILDAQDYPNPLAGILADLQGKSFVLTDPKAGLYRADIREEVEAAKEVAYTEYVIALDWLDGKPYRFLYFVDANADIVVGADAPDEINPVFTPDTPWQLDLEAGFLSNRQTGQTVPLQIIGSAEHIGPAFNDEKQLQVNEYSLEVVLNRDGTARSVRYIMPKSDLTVEILNDFEIPAPVLPPDAREMTEEEIQDAMFRAIAAESIL